MTVGVKEMTRKKQDAQSSAEASKPPTTNTKVDKELLRKARAVADKRDIDLYDYLEAILRLPVESDYDRLLEEDRRPRGH